MTNIIKKIQGNSFIFIFGSIRLNMISHGMGNGLEQFMKCAS